MPGTADRPDDAAPSRSGDIGRRIAQRRAELGLSQEQVAEHAGVALGYLRYVEEQPADVGVGALVRIADALRTSTERLRGEGADLPAGQATAAPSPVLREMSPKACWERLGTHGVGRVALSSATAPTVLPVNYTVVDDTIVYRTTPALAASAATREEVAFEVDRVDDAMRQGWSVLAVGPAEEVTRPDETRVLAERAVSRPWAGGARPAWVRIRPRRVTGRRVLSA